MNQPTHLHPTDQTSTTWSQSTLWTLDGIVEPAPDIIHIDGAERIDWPVTRCPLCRAAMPAGVCQCPACGVELDL